MYLLDTNILVYAVDTRELARMRRANEVIRRLTTHRKAVISTQVLAEFANVTLQRLRSMPSVSEVYRQVELYEKTLTVLPLTPVIVLEAVRGVRDHQLAYYDAQIWAAARMNQVPYVLSEDFNIGATLDGVTFLNPLDSDFDITAL